MNKTTLLKFLQFLMILGAGVLADQWSKHVAESRLASQRPGHFSHHVVLSVPTDFKGTTTVLDVLKKEFTFNSSKEILRIANRYTQSAEGRSLSATDVLQAGASFHVVEREVVVIPGFWDFQYTRNPGAAFGFLAKQNASWRRPFFVVVTLIALSIILYMVYGIMLKQQLLIWALSLIAAGAVGNNLIDRIRFGYVIDFIVWKYTDQYRWPTFNIADVCISIGVGLMAIELFCDALRERRKGREQASTLVQS